MNSFLSIFFDSIVDFIYPPDEDDLLIRRYTPEETWDMVPRAPKTLSGLIYESDVRAIWQYRTPLARALIWKLKYGGSKHSARCIGFALSRYLNENFSEDEAGKIFIIPIPLSRKRRNERGYNQCEWILNECKKHIRNKKYTFDYSVLERIEHRDRQTKKNRIERAKNAEQIFKTSKCIDVHGKTFILIDDVVTTGSTFHEASRALIEAGAEKVLCIAIAH